MTTLTKLKAHKGTDEYLRIESLEHQLQMQLNIIYRFKVSGETYRIPFSKKTQEDVANEQIKLLPNKIAKLKKSLGVQVSDRTLKTLTDDNLMIGFIGGVFNDD